MNALVTLEIVIAAEGLDALVALEGSLRLSLRGLVVHHLAAVLGLTVAGAEERHLAAGLVHVRHDGAAHGGKLAVRTVARVTHAVGDGADAAGARAAGCGRGLAGRLLRRRIRRELRGTGGGVVSGVAAGAGVSVGIRVGGQGRLGRRLRGHDARVLGSGRGHSRVGIVCVVLLDLVKRRRGNAIGAGGGRLRAARVGGEAHAMAVDGLAAVRRRLRQRLLRGVLRLLLLLV